MKRDDELVRRLLFKLEAEPDFAVPLWGDTMGSTAEERKEYGHIFLLGDEGWVDSVGNGGSVRLTAAGHDALNAMRDQGVWERTVKAVAETGGNASLQILKDLGTALLRKKIRDHTGIEL